MKREVTAREVRFSWKAASANGSGRAHCPDQPGDDQVSAVTTESGIGVKVNCARRDLGCFQDV